MASTSLSLRAVISEEGPPVLDKLSGDIFTAASGDVLRTPRKTFPESWLTEPMKYYRIMTVFNLCYCLLYLRQGLTVALAGLELAV